MKLKQYQTDTLSVLRRFFEEARVAGPKGAYEAITKEPDQAKRLGHGQGYAYAHDHPDGIAAQDYLGVEKTYYEPTDRGLERDLGERLAEIRRRLRAGREDSPEEQPPKLDRPPAGS